MEVSTDHESPALGYAKRKIPVFAAICRQGLVEGHSPNGRGSEHHAESVEETDRFASREGLQKAHWHGAAETIDIPGPEARNRSEQAPQPPAPVDLLRVVKDVVAGKATDVLHLRMFKYSDHL